MAGDLLRLTPERLEETAHVQSYAFAASLDVVRRWFERAGHEHTYSFVAGGEVAASAIEVPMGLWLGGRSVKNLGVAGVAVGPRHRGRGLAYELMAALVREGRERGYAVSTLYPATQALYRKVGYQLAGGHYHINLRLDGITSRCREAEIVPLGAGDLERLRPLQARVARQHDGNLDRGAYVWARVFAPRFEDARGFGVAFDGQLEGYTFFTTRTAPSLDQQLELTDLVAETPRAKHALLAFFASHRSLAKKVSWTGGPHDPFVSLLDEQACEVALRYHYMLRILDVGLALEERGYPRATHDRLVLEVSDPELPENGGRFTLEVEDGRGRVERGGAGPALRASINGLSSLYGGYLPASELARLGWLEGDDEALRAADHIFAGRTPWMSEMF